jgi:small-conductance mechanosensitive channel
VEAPQVLRVDSFEESGKSIKVLGVTKPIKQWDVAGELRKRIKDAFDEEGIEIPFPHRVIVAPRTKGKRARKTDLKTGRQRYGKASPKWVRETPMWYAVDLEGGPRHD